MTGRAIELFDVCKSYGDSIAVDRVSASIKAGEFVSLLGPSGSGKTTTLMMVAGFVMPTSGKIVVDGNDVSQVPPRKRGFGMVFQNYSLFPHLNVFDNIAFPLKLRKIPSQEIRDRVTKALDLVQMAKFAQRQISQLSGGQQQRVALARAVVFSPQVILMDEPMGALDKNLRFAMQTEIKEIQQRLRMTVLYVTHDQEEAMTMSDRVVIMKDGRVEQIGAPQEVYDAPTNPFVASFLGEANLFAGSFTGTHGNVSTFTLNDGSVVRCPVSPHVKRGKASLFIRPEHLELRRANSSAEEHGNQLNGIVTRCAFLGSARRYSVKLPSGIDATVDQTNANVSETFEPGQNVMVAWSCGSGRILEQLR